MEDSIPTRSFGKSTSIRDQYRDGKAARIWKYFIGDQDSRKKNYKNTLVKLLREKGCKRILDAACGTGVDSVFLLEEGFEVVSVDASDQMLKYALQTRWNRRKEPAFDKWIISEGNWLTLYDDIEHLVGEGFDAVLCLGNSFPHLLDNYGDKREIKLALRNFAKCLKPGGLFLIDHRNYDYCIKTGRSQPKDQYSNIYYNPTRTTDIKTSVLVVNGSPLLVIRDYLVDISEDSAEKENDKRDVCEFRLRYYPHLPVDFQSMLKEIYGSNSKTEVYADWKPVNAVENPDYYVHIAEKVVKTGVYADWKPVNAVENPDYYVHMTEKAI